MALAFLFCALAWFVDPLAFDALRWKTSLFLTLAPLAFIASLFAGRLKTAAADALPRAFLALGVFVLWSIFVAVLKVEPATLANRPIAGFALLLVVAVLAWADGYERAARWPIAALIAGIPLALLCVAQVLGHDPLYGDVNARHEAVGTFGNTNAAGEFLAPLVPLAAGLALGFGASAWIGRSALPLLVCAVVLTGSRGAAFAVVVASAAVLWFGCRRFAGDARRRVLPIVVALALGALLPFFVGGMDAYAFKSADDAPQSVTSPEYRPNVQRLKLAQAAWSMASHAPLIGHGPGRFEAEFPPFRDPEEAKLVTAYGATSEAEDPHDLYLLLLCEGGVPALALFLAFVLAALAGTRATRILPIGDARIPIALAVGGALLAVLGVGVFRGVLSNPALLVFAFACAGQLLAFSDGPSTASPTVTTKGALAATALFVAITVVGTRGLVADAYFRSAANFAGEPSLDLLDRSLENARAWDPTHTDAIEYRGALLTRFATTAKHTDAARATWNALLAQRPYSLAAHRGLAQLDARAGQLDRAWLHLRLVHRLREGAMPKRRDAALAELVADDDVAYAALLSDAFTRGMADVDALDTATRAREKGDPRARAAAATLLGAWLAKEPWNGDVAYRRGTMLEGADDAQARAAFHRAHLAFALDHLAAAKVADARRSLKLALRYAESAEAKIVEALAQAAEDGKPLPPESKASWTQCDAAFRARVSLLDANPKLVEAIGGLTR